MDDECHNMIEDPIDPYDAWVDDIICSEEFENCTSKDVKSEIRCPKCGT